MNYNPIGPVIIVKITARAVLVSYEGDELWIPQSQIAEDDLADMVEESIMEEINVSSWFCEKEGL